MNLYKYNPPANYPKYSWVFLFCIFIADGFACYLASLRNVEVLLTALFIAAFFNCIIFLVAALLWPTKINSYHHPTAKVALGKRKERASLFRIPYSYLAMLMFILTIVIGVILLLHILHPRH